MEHEYMVVDHSSLTNPVELEGMLNRHAENYWTLVSMTESFAIFWRFKAK